jgi:hypothetical protein
MFALAHTLRAMVANGPLLRREQCVKSSHLIGVSKFLKSSLNRTEMKGLSSLVLCLILKPRSFQSDRNIELGLLAIKSTIF